MQADDRRSHQRHALDLAGVVTIISKQGDSAERVRAKRPCVLLDISFGGARFDIEHPGTEVAQELDLKQCIVRFTIRHASGASVSGEGTPAWTRPSDRAGHISIGLRFPTPNAEIVDTLKGWDQLAAKPKKTELRWEVIALAAVALVAGGWVYLANQRHAEALAAITATLEDHKRENRELSADNASVMEQLGVCTKNSDILAKGLKTAEGSSRFEVKLSHKSGDDPDTTLCTKVIEVKSDRVASISCPMSERLLTVEVTPVTD